MAEPRKEYPDTLKLLKDNVEKSYSYFKPNYERFHEFQRFTFQTAITVNDETTLNEYGKPILEANIANAYVSRQSGEFSKQEPSISVKPAAGSKVDPKTIEVVEGHIRHILFEAKKKNVQYKTYRDSCSGGFSVFKVFTEYAHEMSFDQVIRFDRVYEPTLCGFDPMARLSDKSDGEYCFQLFPMPKDEFSTKYPEVKLDKVSFMKQSGGFSWSYSSEKEDDIVIVCDYYKKKREKKRIVKLANNKVMLEDSYKKAIEKWNSEGHAAQAPAIVSRRSVMFETICRYRFIEDQIINYKETDYKYFPLIFVDGDSAMIKDSDSSAFRQFTKPYVYHIKGIQRLKNFAMQCQGNELENMVMHKIMAPIEGIPQQEDLLKAYKNFQKSQALIYQQYNPELPDQRLDAPQLIPRVEPPAMIANTFMVADQTAQSILGSYDASLGINDNQLSGVAIVEGATQSNAAAMPYIVSYMQALNQVAQCCLDLLPKYFNTPRTIPIVAKDGKHTYQLINQEGGISFDYEANDLQVEVEAGVNFAIAKNKALQQMIALMQASPLFAEFINEEGLETLLDNMEFRGVDIIKEKVEEWTQKLKAVKEKQAQQPNPDQIKAQIAQGNLQMKGAELQSKQQMHQGQLQVDMAKLQADMAKVQADLQMSRDENAREAMRVQSEHATRVHDQALKHEDQKHRHAKEIIETVHTIHQADKEPETEGK